MLHELYPECVDNAGPHGKLAQAITSQLQPAVLAEFDKAMAAVFVAGAEVGLFLNSCIMLIGGWLMLCLTYTPKQQRAA